MNLTVTLDRTDSFRKELPEIADGLCRPGSDFQQKIERHFFFPGAKLDGFIALVRIKDELVGWARTEKWKESTAHEWDTLEAFVLPKHRNRGVAALAATALAADHLYDVANIAVFHPTMLLVARRAGLSAQLFMRRPQERWERV